MALMPKDLSVLAYANGFTLWHYTSPDAQNDILQSGYFSGASHMLRIGDMLMVNAGTHETGRSAFTAVVSSSKPDIVELAVLSTTATA